MEYKRIRVSYEQIEDGTSRYYTLMARDDARFEDIWRSEKAWFMPGSTVTISDEFGNEKTFVKEKE